MERWEYTSIKFETSGWFSGGSLETEEFNYRLNELGEQGWELISCLAMNQVQGTTGEVIAVFKRRG